MLRQRILKALEGSGGLSKHLFRRALTIGQQKYDGRLKPWDLPMDGLLELTLRKKLRKKVGGLVKAGSRAERPSTRTSGFSSNRWG